MLKRALDLFGAACGVIVLAPVFLAIAAGTVATMGRPILFVQTRAGFRGRAMRLWKFRTMSNDRDQSGQLLPDAERLTRFGRFLRATSLDELPQFLNVLEGTMSLVGPRPLPLRYLGRYSERQRRRHDVLPGITGWAQVNGRSDASWDERLARDVWYVEHARVWLDVKILLLTVWQVLARSGVNAGERTDLEEFWGAAGPPAEGPRAFPVEEDESQPVGGRP